MTTPLTACRAWQLLSSHFDTHRALRLQTLFSDDPNRATSFSRELPGLYVDFSRNLVTGETLDLLVQLATERGVAESRAAMFAGEKINTTENRAVLHVALRNRGGQPVIVDGEDVMPAVTGVLQRIEKFSNAVRSGQWPGYSGASITDVVNIGIGGSHLGPQMVTEALTEYAHPDLRCHFVSNVDGTDIHDTLARLQPDRTLFIVASKSFTTQETMTNARTARQWFLDGGGTQDNIARHFVAASTNATAVAEFGIDTANMFGFWDWVGGRYSLWSAIGLPIVLSIGFEHFTELLEGAYELDCHFRDTPLSDNVPVILALLGVWYVNFHDFSSHAVVPYAERLQWLPNYLQQADMESNGKQVTVDGRKVDYHTGPVIWGSPGTNGQHAYFQLLHQGTRVIPADFIVPAKAADSPEPHHDLLLANCLAQGEALMLGRDRATTRAQLRDNGLAGERLDNLTTHRTFPGNRPSNTLLLNELSPKSLGQLIALYEHKIFVQGVIWGINSFDQWGVELGKQLADGILPELRDGASSSRNASTTAIIEKVKEFRK